MDLQLKDKTALVTGGSAGIGKGIARMLAHEGVDVAICARRPDVLAAAADEIARETGRRIVAIPADLTSEDGYVWPLGSPDRKVSIAGIAIMTTVAYYISWSKRQDKPASKAPKPAAGPIAGAPAE